MIQDEALALLRQARDPLDQGKHDTNPVRQTCATCDLVNRIDALLSRAPAQQPEPSMVDDPDQMMSDYRDDPAHAQRQAPVFWYDPVLADKLDTRWSDFMSDQEDPQRNVPLYRFPPSVALLIAEREAQLFEARQTIIKEGLARDAAEKRVGELEEKLAVLLAIQRKILASETAPATPAPATATSGHLR